MNEWIEVAALSAFDKSDRKTIKNAVVFKTEDGFHACENRCPHMGYPMNKGTIRDGILTCAWHNWQFDIDTGGCYRGACDDLQTYPVKVEDDKVWIQLFEPYEHFAMQANRLIEGMRASDAYLQAKAVSMMFKTGGKVADVAAVPMDQAFRHRE
ncbi:MAG: Rieske (2Fe-2S) protein, partial [Lentisphaeraceae bacterium]|nr:Rieske (2Fe-2S) protein [Lentisphaeraceae bacterium]